MGPCTKLLFSLQGRGRSSQRQPTVLYLSTHYGTAADFSYVADSLGLRMTWMAPKLGFHATSKVGPPTEGVESLERKRCASTQGTRTRTRTRTCTHTHACMHACMQACSHVCSYSNGHRLPCWAHTQCRVTTSLCSHLSRQHAQDAEEGWRHYQHLYCGNYDWVIVSDTIALSRPILQHRCTKSRIVLQVCKAY